MTTQFFSNTRWLACAALLALAGCGGGGSGSDDPETGSSAKESGVCGDTTGAINQAALASANCRYLSSYRLFSDAHNPTTGANANGIPYDLNTPLFSDYTSKYRFVFVPEGTAASYDEREAFDFPVGTTLVKTFAMPADTAFRGFAEETLLETRLLIRRDQGWVALPYIWNEQGTDAELSIAGGTFNMTTVHNGQQLDVRHQVPDTNQCKQCHQLSVDGDSSRIEPIGPKARHLNRNFSYDGIEQNQLDYWRNAGILQGVPATAQDIPKVPAYQDIDVAGLGTLSDTEVEAMAKGYLDINCAHCHRPEGGASNTGLHLEYWRDVDTEPSKHGVCKKPVAYGGGALSYDVVPGDAQNSILHFRMASTQPGDRMPEIGRSAQHQEGVALIAEWINRLTAPTCP